MVVAIVVGVSPAYGGADTHFYGQFWAQTRPKLPVADAVGRCVRVGRCGAGRRLKRSLRFTGVLLSPIEPAGWQFVGKVFDSPLMTLMTQEECAAQIGWIHWQVANWGDRG